jgi:hypothetical protein
VATPLPTQNPKEALDPNKVGDRNYLWLPEGWGGK